MEVAKVYRLQAKVNGKLANLLRLQVKLQSERK